MTKLNSIYEAMPPSIQSAICSLYGFHLSKRRYNKHYQEIEKAYLDRDRLDKAALDEFNWNQLKGILNFAYEHVPYYKRYFGNKGISLSEIKTREDYSRLVPVLTKNIVQENFADFKPDNIDKMKTITVKTSGTTGTGLVFPVTIEADMHQWAVWWRYRLRFGLNHKTWYAHFYGKSVVPLAQKRPPFWRVNYPGRQILYSAYHMNDNNMKSYVDSLNYFQPPWIQGYPSLLSLVAEAVKCNGGLNYQPTVVTIGSESLLPHQKALIEDAFGVACRQHYGLTEMSANISECPAGRLHVDEDFAYTEFIESKLITHDIVSTGFVNKAFVLLRYKTGDSVTIPESEVKCPCGRSGRIVENIDGRIEDYITTPDLRKIGRLDHIVKDMVNIKECQIVQKSLNQLVIRVVKSQAYTAQDENKLIKETLKRVGSLMNVSVEYLEKLPRSATGKLRFVVSEIK